MPAITIKNLRKKKNKLGDKTKLFEDEDDDNYYQDGDFVNPLMDESVHKDTTLKTDETVRLDC